MTLQILKHNSVQNCEYINSDNIAFEYFGDWNSNESVIKIAQFSQQKR